MFEKHKEDLTNAEIRKRTSLFCVSIKNTILISVAENILERVSISTFVSISNVKPVRQDDDDDIERYS